MVVARSHKIFEYERDSWGSRIAPAKRISNFVAHIKFVMMLFRPIFQVTVMNLPSSPSKPECHITELSTCSMINNSFKLKEYLNHQLLVVCSMNTFLL